MGVDHDQRLLVGERISRALSHPEAAAMFPARTPSGKRHVVVVLSTDTYGEVVTRTKNLRGPINVAVATWSLDEIDVLIFERSDTETKPQDECEVGPDSEIGLLVALLRRTQLATQVELRMPKYVTVLVDGGMPVPI